MANISPQNRVLDWVPAEDRSHEVKWAAPKAVDPFTVERYISLPWWHWDHDQGNEGSCVGHGVVMERAISNIAQNRANNSKPYSRRYDPIDVWNRAKIRDEWPDTNPGDENGTSVHAGYEVALYEGLRRVSGMRLNDQNVPVPYKEQALDPNAGVSAVRWANTVDEVRFAIKQGNPVTIGINWYSNFDNPVQKPGYSLFWMGEGDLGSIRGGHCVCIYGASDKRQAVRIKNSWGRSYPLVWMPYTTLQRLLNEDGEAALVTDR